MKNIKILICLLSILLLTGCGSSKNKLVSYLEDNPYECLKNVCVKNSTERDNVQVITTYDIDNKTMTIDTKFTSLQTSNFTYVWDEKQASYTYTLIDETFNVHYNFDDLESKCTSNGKDEVYKSAQCKTLLEDVENNVNNFYEAIEKSGYEIK